MFSSPNLYVWATDDLLSAHYLLNVMPMKKTEIYASEKKWSLENLPLFCIACSWKNNLCRARWDWDNLANGIFSRHKLQVVFTEVNEWIHVLLNITHRSMYAQLQSLEYRYWRQSAQFFPIQTEELKVFFFFFFF